jgi:two-component system chemotaxis response regulator CheB
MSIRVLIVDDSRTYAAGIKRILEGAPDFEVVGVAEDGEQGLAKVHELQPHVVLMDVNMPRMNGLEATERIMAERPTPILLMTTAENLAKEVDLALRAVDEMGALDLIPKPDFDPRGPGAKRLLDLIRLIARVPVISHLRGSQRRRRPTFDDSSQWRLQKGSSVHKRARKIVAVASSTGGPRALRTFLEQLPASLPAGVLIVQHIEGAFVDGLVRWLGEGLPLPVMVATDRQSIHEGDVLVAPAGFHLEVTGERKVVLVKGTPDGGHIPSGNRLLTSAAAVYGANAIGVVLTGMGEDGARGLLAIKRAGGPTFAQDEATSVIYGMPRAAKELGAAGQVLPLGKIAEAVAGVLHA